MSTETGNNQGSIFILIFDFTYRWKVSLFCILLLFSSGTKNHDNEYEEERISLDGECGKDMRENANKLVTNDKNAVDSEIQRLREERKRRK